jgi:transmembrane sensor
MNAEELDQLLEKYLEGKCTPEETLLVEQLVDNYDNKSTAWTDLNNNKQQVWLQQLWAEIKASMLTYETQYLKFKRFKLWSRIAAAAAVLLIVGAGLFFYTQRHLEGSAATRDPLANDIKPGGNKAYLVLSNGKRVSLTDAANGELAKEAGVEITKTADGQVIYTAKAPSLPAASLPGGARGSVGANSDGIKYSNALNTIETPRGGQYQIRLPDGSKVWLNAASKLIYPVSFNGRGQRVVELSGEAYFEIFKNKLQPFVVKSKNQEVTVLGTHFNINSYTDEPGTKTTLLEGSVRVNDATLKPGQQATLTNNQLKIAEVNTDEAIAWKNGLFAYKNTPLQNVMRQIARWYDVDIIYQNNDLPQKLLSGSVSRYDQVSGILKAIESTGTARFKIEGRKITVLP